MLHPDGIEVCIKSLARYEPYVEYVEPHNSESSNSKSVERYIEIIPGEHFAINVKVTENFDFRGQRGAWVHYLIDGGTSVGNMYRNLKRFKIHPVVEISEGAHMVEGAQILAGFCFAQWECGKNYSYCHMCEHCS
jgi:hypothetical protein